MQIKKGLYVITGGPGTGKTTLIEELEKVGFPIVNEIAREIIKEQMLRGGEALPWKNTTLYTEMMLERSVLSYLQHTYNMGTLFFDRGIPDILAYARLIGLQDVTSILSSVKKYRYNDPVFILPPWEDIYCTDTERKQSFREAIDTYNIMKHVYRDCGYIVIEVPKLSVADRRDFVIDCVKLS